MYRYIFILSIQEKKFFNKNHIIENIIDILYFILTYTDIKYKISRKLIHFLFFKNKYYMCYLYTLIDLSHYFVHKSIKVLTISKK